MSEAEPDEYALVILLKALDSKQDEERADAIRRVQTLAPAALLTLSRMEVQHFRRYRRGDWRTAFLIVAIVYTPIFLLACKLHARPGVYIFNLYMIVMLYIVLPNIRHLYSGFRPSKARQSIANALEDVDSIHFVPVALTLLQDKTADIMPAIYTLLKRLLPQLHVEDTQNWTPEQYQKLLALLADRKQEPELRLSILKALEQIGDARAIPVVEALTAFDRDTPILVRRAAADCLPFLQERAVEQRQAQTLLRAAAGNTQGTDLLRGASGANTQTPEEQLLRPR